MPALLPNRHIEDSNLANGMGNNRIVQNDLLYSTDCCYEVQAFLGEGAFGQVARCREVDTNMEVAIKIFKNYPDHVLLAEVNMLKRISGENPEKNHFVRWYEWFQYGGHTCLVFELLELSLFDYMAQINFNPMPLKDIQPIVQQLNTALKKLQSLGLIHTDIKPENVMLVGPVGQPFRVKMIDFGLACNISDAQPGASVQTRCYRSPEVLLGLPFSEAIDMWSLGCVAVGLFLGYLLYPGRSPYEMMRYTTETQGQLADHLLSAGVFTSYFFVRDSDRNSPRRRLKTPEEYKGDRNLKSEENGRYIFSSLDELKGFKLPSNLRQIEMMNEVQDREVFVDLVKQMLQLDAGRRITPLQVLDHPFITRSSVIKSVKSGIHTLPTSSLLQFRIHETTRCPVIPLQGDMAREIKGTSSHVNYEPSKGGITFTKSSLNLEREGERQQEHGKFVLNTIQQKLDLPQKETSIFLAPSPLPDPIRDTSCFTTRGGQNEMPNSSSDSRKSVSMDTGKSSLYQQDSARTSSPVPQILSLQSTLKKTKRMATELTETGNSKKRKLEQPSPVPKACYSPGIGGVENRQHGCVVMSNLIEAPAPLAKPHIKDSSLANGRNNRIVQNDLLCSTNRGFEVQASLGEGAFGQVAWCRMVDTNMEVAIKMFKNHPDDVLMAGIVQAFLGEGAFGQVAQYRMVDTNMGVAIKNHPDHIQMAEVKMLKRISGENPEKNHFVRWYEWFQYRGHTCLVFELLELSLFDHVAQIHFSHMPLKDIQPIVLQLAIALKILKSLGLIHTDIKPENVMLVGPVGQPFRVKIIDFGLACNISLAQPGASVQTLYCRSPEVLLGLPFSEAIDMWSLGCVAVGLFLGYFLYPGRSPYEMIQGQLADHLLSTGVFTNFFFVRDWDWNSPQWRLKTPEEYKDDRNLKSKENERYIFKSLSKQKGIKLPPNPKQIEMMAKVQGREVFVDLVKQMLQLDAGRRITPLQVLDHPFITRRRLIKSRETTRCPIIPVQGDMDEEDQRTSSHVNFDPRKGVTRKKFLRIEIGGVESSHSDRKKNMKKLELPPSVQTINSSRSDLERDKHRQQEPGEFDPATDTSCFTTRGGQNERPNSSSDSRKSVSIDTAKLSWYQQDSTSTPSPIPQILSLQAAQRKRKMTVTEFAESRNSKKRKLEQASSVPKACCSQGIGGVEDRQHGHYDPIDDGPGSTNEEDFKKDHQTNRLSSSSDSEEALSLSISQTSSCLNVAQGERPRIETETTKSSNRTGMIAALIKCFLASVISPAIRRNNDRKEEHNEFACCFSSPVPDQITNSSQSVFRTESMVEETERQSCLLEKREAVCLTTHQSKQDTPTVHGLAQKKVPANPHFKGLRSLEKRHLKSLTLYLIFAIQRERSAKRIPLLSNNMETLPIASVQSNIKPRPPVITVRVQIQIQIKFQFKFKSESETEQ